MRLELAVFDLDYTVWQPEMYQIYGPPSLVNISDLQPKRKRKNRTATQPIKNIGFGSIQKGKTVVDQHGTPITIFGGA